MTKEDLKEFREGKLKMTQGELALALRVAPNTVSRWEIGDRQIPPYLDLALETVERETVKNG